LLSQLSATPRFATLAGEIAELQGRLQGSWLTIPTLAGDAIEAGTSRLTAMRLNVSQAVMLLRTGDRLPNQQDLVVTDPVTGLAVIRTNDASMPAGVPPWMPQALAAPRYLMATVGTPSGVSLRPVLVGSLHETRSPAWSGPIWSLPEGTDLSAASFVFTSSGEIAGLVVREPAGLAIVPWNVVVADASRMLADGRARPADLRIEVRPLTPELARASGASEGVVVAWVDSRGPAARRIGVGDVIQSINSQPLINMRDWEVVSSRLAAGEVTIRVRRRGKPMDLRLTVPAADAIAARDSLGLRMRNAPGVGATVVRIDPRSAASAAGLREGDVITLAGDITAPTASQVGNAFRSARVGDAIMLAITRGHEHLVVGLVK
jgi:S1-C subfamily serine protease